MLQLQRKQMFIFGRGLTIPLSIDTQNERIAFREHRSF